MIDVLLRLPGNTPQEKIDQLATDYDLRVYRVIRLGMVIVQCLASVESVFAMGRERPHFVLGCEEEQEFQTMVSGVRV